MVKMHDSMPPMAPMMPPSTNEQPIWLFSWIANTRYATIFRTTILVFIIVLATNYILSYIGILNILPIGVLVSLAILIAVSPFAYREIGLAIVQARAEINAVAERITGMDLDGSGAIGDIPAQEPVVKETIRPVLVRASGKIRTIEGLPDGYTREDFDEFISGVQTRGLRRSAWLNPQYRFESGRLCNRAFHDAAMKILERMDAVAGRERGSDGYLTKTPEQIIVELGG